MKKYVVAAESALAISEKKDQDRDEIFGAFQELIEQIVEWKSGAINLKLEVKKSDNELKNLMIGTALGAMIGVNLKEKETNTSVENNNQTLDYVLKANNEKKSFHITDVSLSNVGYPCSIQVDGNKVVSYDLETLEESLGKLIASVHVGDIFRRILSK